MNAHAAPRVERVYDPTEGSWAKVRAWLERIRRPPEGQEELDATG